MDAQAGDNAAPQREVAVASFPSPPLAAGKVPAAGPVWEYLPADENPLFRANKKLQQVRGRPLRLKHTWIPFKDTPLSCSVNSTSSSRGLLAILACKEVQANCKLLQTFAITVAGHRQVEKLEGCRKSAFCKSSGFAFLQSCPPNSKFDPFSTSEPQGQTLVLTADSYLALLSFFSESWPLVEEKVRQTMASIDSNSMVDQISPGVMLSGDGHFVVSSVALEEFGTFSLFLDISANSRCKRGSEISASLRYTDESFHSELHRDERGVCRYGLPVGALAGHAKNLYFFQNVLLADSDESLGSPCPATDELAAAEVQTEGTEIVLQFELPASLTGVVSDDAVPEVPRTPGASHYSQAVAAAAATPLLPTKTTENLPATVVPRYSGYKTIGGKDLSSITSDSAKLCQEISSWARNPSLERNGQENPRVASSANPPARHHSDEYSEGSPSPAAIKRVDESWGGQSSSSSRYKRSSPSRNWKDSRDPPKRSKLSAGREKKALFR